MAHFVRKGDIVTPFPQRFWAKVDQRQGPQGCWPWLGAKSRKRSETQRGHIKSHGRNLLAHRVALWLQTDPEATSMVGYDGPMGDARLQACHARSCTTRLCCNPAHLYWGTFAENVADRRATQWQTMVDDVLQEAFGGQGCLPFVVAGFVSFPEDTIWRVIAE